MDLETLVALAVSRQASDLHLEGGLPPTVRIRGELVAGSQVSSRTVWSQWCVSGWSGGRSWDCGFLSVRSWWPTRLSAR